jgi:hypothetical protein
VSDCQSTLGSKHVDEEHHAGSNKQLMKVLRQEADLAVQRIEKHWKRVIEKQRECERLSQELCRLENDLSSLRCHETHAKCKFDRALEVLRNRKLLKESEYRAAALHFPVKRKSYENHIDTNAAQSAMQEAKSAYDSLDAEQHVTSGARSSEGKDLQRAKHAVIEKEKAIAGVEKQLEKAAKPPAPVYQPLPDCEDEFNALAVLFYTRSELTGSMPLLQQFCCAAQLAVCPWPLQRAGLWDVQAALSAAEIAFSTWNEYFRSKTETCCYLPRSSEGEAFDLSSDVHIFTGCPVPTVDEVFPSSRMSLSFLQLCLVIY